MSSSPWRPRRNPTTLPPAAERPARRRRSQWLWDRCEERALMSLIVGDTTSIEPGSGTGNAVFTVLLDHRSSQPVQVEYGTADGTAKAGVDYQAVGGALNFHPGDTTRTITVPIVGGASAKPQESFTVNLSSPSNAAIADGHGTGTISTASTPTPTPTPT